MHSAIFSVLALASGAAAKAIWATPHDKYSSSIGVLGCKINTNRVAYWPGSVSCDNICVKVSHEGRSVNLLRIDQSGGAYDISYDAWVYLQTGKSAEANPISGGTVPMEYEEVDASECADLLDNGKVPLSASNSINFLSSCLEQPSSYVAKNHVLYNICDAICTQGHDEKCTLDLSVSNQPSCPNILGLTVPLDSAPVVDIAYQTGERLLAGSGTPAPSGAGSSSGSAVAGSGSSSSGSSSGSSSNSNESSSESTEYEAPAEEVQAAAPSSSAAPAAPSSSAAPAPAPKPTTPTGGVFVEVTTSLEEAPATSAAPVTSSAVEVVETTAAAPTTTAEAETSVAAVPSSTVLTTVVSSSVATPIPSSSWSANSTSTGGLTAPSSSTWSVVTLSSTVVVNPTPTPSGDGSDDLPGSAAAHVAGAPVFVLVASILCSMAVLF